MNEIFPITYGLFIGLISSFIPGTRWRYGSWAFLSLLFGVVATFVTGEWKIGWEFLLIDIPLAAVCGLAVIAVRLWLKRRARAAS